MFELRSKHDLASGPRAQGRCCWPYAKRSTGTSSYSLGQELRQGLPSQLSSAGETPSTRHRWPASRSHPPEYSPLGSRLVKMEQPTTSASKITNAGSGSCDGARCVFTSWSSSATVVISNMPAELQPANMHMKSIREKRCRPSMLEALRLTGSTTIVAVARAN